MAGLLRACDGGPAARPPYPSVLIAKRPERISEKSWLDGRSVRTKFAKSFKTWFFPVDPMFREELARWLELRTKFLAGMPE